MTLSSLSPTNDHSAGEGSVSAKESSESSAPNSERTVRFLDAEGDENRQASQFLETGSSLEPIISAASSVENGEAEKAAANDYCIDQTAKMYKTHFVNTEKPSSANRLRSNSSLRRTFYGSRHLSLMKPAQQRSMSKLATHNIPNHTIEEQDESYSVSPHTAPDQLEFPEVRGRHRSQSTPAQYRKTNDESPIPSALARLGSFAADGSRRKRRPTVSEAGVAIVDGITEVVPHPGIMAAAFSSAAVAPTPAEVLRRKSTTGEKSHADKNTDDLKVSKGYYMTLMMSYIKLVWKFVTTAKGLFIVVYLCLVIAFGGMLFLILIGAAPAMNKHDSPDSDDTPGKRWIEIDSQVLNGLFCLTGFGLMPQRTKHLYFLIKGQIKGKETTERQLMKRYTWYIPGRNWPQLATVLYLYELNSVFQIFMAAG